MSIQRDYILTYTVNTAQATQALADLRPKIWATGVASDATAKQIQELDAALKGLATSATGTVMPAMHSSGESVKGLGATVAGLATSWFVLEHGVEMIGKFGEKANMALDLMKELGEDVRNMRDDFRELANLKHKDGPDDEVIAETLQMGARAGLMPTDARKFMEQYEGSSPAGKQQGHIDDKTAAALAQEGMKFGARVKINANTAGDLTGVLSQYEKIPNVEHGAKRLGQIAYGLNEGRGNLEPLMRSLIKTAGSVVNEDGGPIPNLAELGVQIGVASTHSSPDAAGTKVRSATRTLREFQGKQGRTLEALGIKPGMSYMDSLRKIAPEVLKADKEGIGGDTYLRNSGFTDKMEITAILEQSRDLEFMEKRLITSQGKNGKGGIQGADVIAQNNRYLKTDKNGISRRIRAATAVQEKIRGMEVEQKNMAKEAATVKMIDNHEVGGTGNFLQEVWGDAIGIKPLIGIRKSSDRWKDEKALETAHEAIYRAKIKAGKNPIAAFIEMQKENPENFDQSEPIRKYWAAATPLNEDFISGKAGITIADENDRTRAVHEALGSQPLKTWGGTSDYWNSDQTRNRGMKRTMENAERAGADPYTDTSKVIEPHLKELIQETKKTNAILVQNQGKAGPAAPAGMNPGLPPGRAVVPVR